MSSGHPHSPAHATTQRRATHPRQAEPTMFNAADTDDSQVTPDGFGLREGAALVGPAEFLAKAPRGHLVMTVIIEALAAAADDDGSLLDFGGRAFYDDYVTQAVGLSAVDPPLHYDAFTAMTLVEAFIWLRTGGHLAHRGNGDSYDYWLAAPSA